MCCVSITVNMCVCVLITASMHVCANVHMYALSSFGDVRVCVYRPFFGDYVYVYIAASTGVFCMTYFFFLI